MSSRAELAPAPDAPLGKADATRRWGVRLDGGAVIFPGLTRPEARAVAGLLVDGDLGDHHHLSVSVELPAVLSDGAGPHLLGADGALALALGPHPHLVHLRVAMAEPRPDHRIGVVAMVDEGPLWRWQAEAMVTPEARVDALDALASIGAEDDVAAWALRFGASER